jgi:16S rRNA (guanine966-N2)-methyltransferase
MRVIGGEFRSRQLKTLPGLEVRPTPDRLRETLFNILAPRIEGAVFADIYAGSGAVGIEALSRGASRAIFVEQSRASIALPNVRAGIIFLDPPYEAEPEYLKSLVALGENPAAMIVVQHFSKLVLQESYGAIKRVRVVKQGQNALSFYSKSVS